MEELVAATQDMVRKQTSKYTEQIEKLAFSNQLIKQIYSENETLVRAIQGLQTACIVDEEEEGEKETKEGVKKSGEMRTKVGEKKDERIKIPKPSRTYAVQSFHK